MRIARLLAVAALTSLSVAGSAAVAVADDQPSSSITPNSARAGSSVILSLEGGCKLSSVKAVSKGFTEPVILSTGSAHLYTGTATVADVDPGTYTVTYWCDNDVALTDSFRVEGKDRDHTTPSPSGGVRTGDGGSITSGSTAQTAGGIALLAVAAGGGVHLLRRRAASHKA